MTIAQSSQAIDGRDALFLYLMPFTHQVGQELMMPVLRVTEVDDKLVDTIDSPGAPAAPARQTSVGPSARTIASLERIICSQCGARLKLKREIAARKIKCPKCGGVLSPPEPGLSDEMKVPRASQSDWDPSTVAAAISIGFGVISFFAVPRVFRNGWDSGSAAVLAAWVLLPLLFVPVPLGLLVARRLYLRIESLLNRADSESALELVNMAFNSLRFAGGDISPRMRQALQDGRIREQIVQCTLSGRLEETLSRQVLEVIGRPALLQLIEMLRHNDQGTRHAAANRLHLLNWNPESAEEHALINAVDAEARKKREEAEARKKRAEAGGRSLVHALVLISGSQPANEQRYLGQILKEVGITGCKVEIKYVDRDKLNRFYVMGLVTEMQFDPDDSSITPFDDADGGSGFVVKIYN